MSTISTRLNFPSDRRQKHLVTKGEQTAFSSLNFCLSISMCGKFYLAFVVAMIVGTILSMTEVDAQPTVDESASCESSTFDEAVDLIKQGMNNVGLIGEDVKTVKLIGDDVRDVKKLLGSNPQQNNESSIKKDLEDLKTAIDALAQQQNNASDISKKELADVKAVCLSSSSTSMFLYAFYRAAWNADAV